MQNTVRTQIIALLYPTGYEPQKPEQPTRNRCNKTWTKNALWMYL